MSKASVILDKVVPVIATAFHDFLSSNGTVHPPAMPSGPSLTRQEFADDCDINVLMRRFENQDIGAVMRRAAEPFYADFSAIPSDLMGTLQFMEEATQAFMTLPASVRRDFENNPHAFVQYAVDPANVEQMRAWGLAKPAQVVSQPPTSSSSSGSSAASTPSPASPGAPASSSSATA
jgi:hypothetical protein